MRPQPPDVMQLQQGASFVTKLKTKILLRMDYVLQCQGDEEALNGWRLLCGDGVALVRMAVEKRAFDQLDTPEPWIKLAESVLAKWPLKTAEKTSVVRETGCYRCEYDHYNVEVRKEDLELGLQSLKEEKFNVINSTLASIWGDCYSIILIVGYLDLEEQIELPVQRDYYSDKDISSEMSSRRD